MKLVLLKSHGGDYLVVAQNIAWLLAHEHGQTLVGIIGGAPIQIGGAPIQVAGTLDQTAPAILEP